MQQGARGSAALQHACAHMFCPDGSSASEQGGKESGARLVPGPASANAQRGPGACFWKKLGEQVGRGKGFSNNMNSNSQWQQPWAAARSGPTYPAAGPGAGSGLQRGGRAQALFRLSPESACVTGGRERL